MSDIDPCDHERSYLGRCMECGTVTGRLALENVAVLNADVYLYENGGAVKVAESEYVPGANRRYRATMADGVDLVVRNGGAEGVLEAVEEYLSRHPFAQV